MAKLKGFPPSNSISPTTHLPEIVEIPIKIINLKPEEKFRHRDSEFMRMTNVSHRKEIRAICYKSAFSDFHDPGTVYCFSPDKEVIWLREVYFGQEVFPANCCQYCGVKLTSDNLSSQFGDYCMNEMCKRC